MIKMIRVEKKQTNKLDVRSESEQQQQQQQQQQQREKKNEIDIKNSIDCFHFLFFFLSNQATKI